MRGDAADAPAAAAAAGDARAYRQGFAPAHVDGGTGAGDAFAGLVRYHGFGYVAEGLDVEGGWVGGFCRGVVVLHVDFTASACV